MVELGLRCSSLECGFGVFGLTAVCGPDEQLARPGEGAESDARVDGVLVIDAVACVLDVTRR